MLLLVVGVLCLIALLLRWQRLRFGFAHQVLDYDEGVYFGSALSLVDGRLPYRDFVFVHPPLIGIGLTPVALLAKLTGTGFALGVATLLTGAAGAASVPLVARLVWHRGTRVVVPAAGLAALQSDAIAGSHTVLLEPWVVLLCLLGATLAFRGDQPSSGRRAAAAGIVLGLACATKIWAVVPLLAIVVVCAPARRRLLAGAAVGFGVPTLPFVVLAPGAFVHEVFWDQIFRASPVRTPLSFRLVHLFAAAPPDGSRAVTGQAWLVVLAVALGTAVAIAAGRGLRTAAPLDRFAGLAAVLVVAMLFVPGTFYWHYAAFAAPFVAVAAALAVTRLGRRSGQVWTAALTAMVIALAGFAADQVATSRGAIDEYAAFTAAVPRSACVVATMPSFTVANDRYRVSSSCPQLVDPFGTALAYSDGRAPGSRPPTGPRLAAAWLAVLRHADYVYVDRRQTRVLPVTGPVGAVMREQFRPVAVDGLTGTLYRRTR